MIQNPLTDYVPASALKMPITARRRAAIAALRKWKSNYAWAMRDTCILGCLRDRFNTQGNEYSFGSATYLPRRTADFWGSFFGLPQERYLALYDLFYVTPRDHTEALTELTHILRPNSK